MSERYAKGEVPDINAGEIRKAELIIEVMEWVDMAGLIIEPIIFIRYNYARFKSLPSMTYYVKGEDNEASNLQDVCG